MWQRGVAQLVARLLWEQDAAGSNPVTPIPAKSAYLHGFCKYVLFGIMVRMRFLCRLLYKEQIIAEGWVSV